MMAAIPDEPAVVKAVALELYVPFDVEPQTPEELAMAARGQVFLGDLDGARQLLLRACAGELSFKFALELHVIALVEIRDRALGDLVEAAIHERYPLYEIKFKGVYQPPDPSILQLEDE
jgi:hypothetical protein